MGNRYEMRLAGSGGQGVILASVILAEAAVDSGVTVIQSQSYGPEARGGVCRAELVLSRGTLWFPKVTRPDFLLALTQASLDKYGRELAEGAIVMVDDSLTVPEWLEGARLVPLPILGTARDAVGKLFTANVVAVGAINALLGLFDEKALLEGAMRRLPAGSEEINKSALAAGAALVSPELAAAFAQKIG
ncbi:MAG: 2-oxoacid:acceptor oxidoreductase family protein [Oscillospiraceae bacterium]|nr:2-oxoacid:acceptor oxidoreductase family protein [Oscillospiraceae bacterium]